MARGHGGSEPQDAAPPIRILVVEREENAGFGRLPTHSDEVATTVVESVRDLPADLSSFTIVVFNNVSPDSLVPRPSDSALAAFVRGGGGCLAIHDSVAPLFQDLEIFRLMGLQYATDAFGPAHLPSGESVISLGLALGHPSDSLRMFPVQPYSTARHHPIVRGIGRFDVGDELWAANSTSDVIPLLFAEIGDRIPNIFDRLRRPTIVGGCRTEEHGRCVFLQLGHVNETYDHQSVRRYCRNAILWLAKRLPLARWRYDLFISHSARNRRRAESIEYLASKHMLRCFLSASRLRSGDEWSERVRTAIVGSREMCVLMSDRASTSEWVTTEWGAAWALKKRITPILIGLRPSDLPDRLKVRQAITYETAEEFVRDASRRRDRENK